MIYGKWVKPNRTNILIMVNGCFTKQTINRKVLMVTQYKYYEKIFPNL